MTPIRTPERMEYILDKKTFLVSSTVLVEADDAKGAAIRALAKVWRSTETVYAVTDPDHQVHKVILTDLEMKKAISATID
jgi:hypothetical protein